MLHDALGFGACHLGLGVPMTGRFADVNSLEQLKAMGWSEQNPLRWGRRLLCQGLGFYVLLIFWFAAVSLWSGILSLPKLCWVVGALEGSVEMGSGA